MELFKSLFAHHPDAIFILNQAGDFVDANPAFERMLGYAPDEYSSISLKTLISDEAYELAAKHIQLAMHDQPQKFEQAVFRKNGSPVDASVTIVPILLNNDDVFGVFVSIRDITKKKNTLRRMQEIEELYQLISMYSLDIISYTSSDGICHYISPAVEQVLGYQPEELIGKSFFSYIHPDDQKWGHDSNIFTTRVRCKNGEYVWLETTIQGTRNKLGEGITISVSRDVTSRKMVENALRESEYRLKQAQQIASLGSWEYDPQTCTSFWSDEVFRIYGLEPQGAIKQSDIVNLIHPDDRSVFIQSIGELVNGNPYDIELRIIRSDGQLRHVRSRRTVTDEGRLIGILQDITEQKETEELLIKSEKLAVVGELAAGIGHEIRNPLTAIKGFAQLLKLKYREDRHFDIILSELDRINSIVSELMVLSKPQAIQFKPNDIRSIVNGVLPLIETQAIINNVDIRIWFEEELPLIVCEENQIKQVLINLLKNAIESMPDGGQAYLRVQRQNEAFVKIVLQDEGSGIPEERLAKIGEPFYSTKEKGNGLGLMVSNKIIYNHNGKLEISSQLGLGTTVEVILPVNALGIKELQVE